MPGIRFRQAMAGRIADLSKSVVEKTTQYHFIQHQLESVGLSRNSHQDTLTGLLTRPSFEKSLREFPRTSPASTAVIFIDLDRFKPINDEYGHHIGDQLLTELAKRLADVIPVVGRVGGDEFVGLIDYESDPDDLNLFEIIATILDQIKQPFYIFEHDPEASVTVDASVGIRRLGPVVDVAQEIKDADQAMYYAKRNGGPWRIWDDVVESKSHRHTIDSKRHLATRHDDLELAYQLIYSLTTGEVCMVEASIKVPGENTEIFMSNIERRNSINRPMFLAMLERACETAVAWPLNASGRHITLSFNLPVQLIDLGLRRKVFEILDRTGLKPHHLQFEVLERGKLAGNIDAQRNIQQMRAKGICFFLDDVGEKNANIEVIHEYDEHLTGLKIGTTFTLDMIHDYRKRALVETMLFMAAKLDKVAVVEGIESLAALQIVAPYQPPYVQGYLMHKPEPDGPSLHAEMTRTSQICRDLCTTPFQIN